MARGLCSRCYARYKRGLGPNETRQYTTRETKERVQALTIDEVTALRQALKKMARRRGREGPDPLTELLDVVDLMLGTGMRIGEVLALRWSDVDFGEHPRLTVSGTLVPIKENGLIRQPHTKTASGYRALTLPTFVVEVLLR